MSHLKSEFLFSYLDLLPFVRRKHLCWSGLDGRWKGHAASSLANRKRGEVGSAEPVAGTTHPTASGELTGQTAISQLCYTMARPLPHSTIADTRNVHDSAAVRIQPDANVVQDGANVGGDAHDCFL